MRCVLALLKKLVSLALRFGKDTDLIDWKLQTSRPSWLLDETEFVCISMSNKRAVVLRVWRNLKLCQICVVLFVFWQFMFGIIASS